MHFALDEKTKQQRTNFVFTQEPCVANSLQMMFVYVKLLFSFLEGLFFNEKTDKM